MRLPAILVSPGGTFVVVGLATVLSQALLTLASSDQTHHHQQQQQPQRQREEVTVEVLGTVDISSGLHKNGGVDFRVEGGPRIDYQHIPSEASVASENYEFQSYDLNITNTFVRDGIFYIRPTLTENRIGIKALRETGVLDFWGSDPGSQCTGNYDYGCFRVAGAGGNILNPVQSGLVRSVNAFKFRFGKVVVRAKMPKGKWIWPAIWLLPAYYQYGTWPASGEIDLVESRGNGPEYPGGGYDKIASTLHWGPSYEYNRFQLTHAEYALPQGQSFADEFHVFTLDWTPEGIKTYVDDDLLLDVPFNNMFKKGKFPAWIDNLWEGSDSAPFDQEFYLIMNVAVGGTAGYFPDGVGNKPWSDKSEHAVNEFYAAKDDWYPTWGPENGLDRALAVDYVRVYKHDC
ncbi:hypothetical protein BG000_001852 [Podila horticola]|nr:hypothetical protein BG000_001852 [Podila horticola]